MNKSIKRPVKIVGEHSWRGWWFNQSLKAKCNVEKENNSEQKLA